MSFLQVHACFDCQISRICKHSGVPAPFTGKQAIFMQVTAEMAAVANDKASLAAIWTPWVIPINHQVSPNGCSVIAFPLGGGGIDRKSPGESPVIPVEALSSYPIFLVCLPAIAKHNNRVIAFAHLELRLFSIRLVSLPHAGFFWSRRE